jgi:hypothetical protein
MEDCLEERNGESVLTEKERTFLGPSCVAESEDVFVPVFVRQQRVCH